MRHLTDRYRPELHYMRGPGPKWLEKHAGHAGALVVQGEGHQLGVSPLRRIELSFRRWLPARWRAAHRAHGEMAWNPTTGSARGRCKRHRRVLGFASVAPGRAARNFLVDIL